MFDWSKASLHRNTNEKRKILTDILLNVFKKLIFHKTQKFDYKTLNWMNRLIMLFFKNNIKTYREILCQSNR